MIMCSVGCGRNARVIGGGVTAAWTCVTCEEARAKNPEYTPPIANVVITTARVGQQKQAKKK